MKDDKATMSVLVWGDNVTLLMKQITFIHLCRGHVSEIQQTWDMEVLSNRNEFK